MPRRPHPGTDRSLEGPVLHFRLLEELHRLKDEPNWKGGKRTITLTKQAGLRVVLVALLAGGTLDQHLAAGALTLQVLEGRLRLAAGGETRTLLPNELLVLEPALPHEVQAEDASAFLLTLAQPPGR